MVSMKNYIKFCKEFNKVMVMLGVIFLIATVLTCLLQVVTREIFNFPFSWTEELTRYLIIYAVYFISGTLLLNDENPRIEIIYAWLPKRAQKYLNYLYYILIAVLMLVLGFYGCKVVESSKTNWCGSIRIPWAIPFSAVVVGSVNMLLQIPTKFYLNHLELKALADEKNQKEGGEIA